MQTEKQVKDRLKFLEEVKNNPDFKDSKELQDDIESQIVAVKLVLGD